MKMQIKEFAQFAGVSVRTLHYYDEIGLLTPADVDAATGYRYYNEKSMLCMQEILFYRELDFSLKDIRNILSSPDYNRTQALQQQKQLLTLKKERLEKLIDAIDDAMKGENIMKAFDNSQFEQYKAEAKENWGKTDAYKEHSEKTKNYSADKWTGLASEMNEIMQQFAVYMKNGSDADSPAVQSLVKTLQNHITRNYYNCTKEILSGLGLMYVGDKRFKNNIDKYGDGNAQFICDAIQIYCQK